ncbi:MAG: putative toxin-antitoxin system toxin component, PIN family [Legionellales bacterium]|nr:putative toxin-antitoxin system toxin component, PIN family [Legionellales bacterium]
MIEVVIDTNVVISGMGWSGYPKKIIDAWIEENFIVKATKDIIKEYQVTCFLLAKKYPSVMFEEVLNKLLLKIYLCEPVKMISPLSRDPDDDKFIACTLNTKSKIIISGDRDLLDIPVNNSFTVLKPNEFCKKYL